MNTRTTLAATALVLLSGGAFAAGGYIPAGQGPIDGTPSRTSTITRAEVSRDVALARDAGRLVPAGQGVLGGRPATTSVVARSTVKSDTVQARVNGGLVPAGEGQIEARLAQRRAREFPVAFARR